MAKWAGVVGFGLSVETAPGVWEDQIVEKSYFGDVVRNSLRVQAGQDVNDDLTLGHSISIVADAFTNQNSSAIRYAMWKGVAWKVVHIEDQRPRLLLRLGGVHNGPKAGSPATP